MKKLKIFVITTELPARIGGAPMRNFNLIKYLDKNRFAVSLFTIIDDKTKKILPEVKKELNIPIYAVSFKGSNLIKKLYISLIKCVIPYMEEYKESGIVNILLDKINKVHPDVIQLEEINAYFAIEKIIPFIKGKKIKIILDAHNVETIAFKEALKIFHLIKRIIGKRILPNYINMENRAIKLVDNVFTCSAVDKKYFVNIVNPKIITVIPNGADTTYFKPKKQVSENSLLFMGRADYPPNEEALRYYFLDIHPLVMKIIPDIKIYVLCGKSPHWLNKITRNDPSIILPGFVVDVREYLNKAKICIAPIKSGSGTRLKILEYMAMGKPTVASSKSVEGLEVVSGKNIIVADNPHEFAKKIIWLIENLNESRKMGKRAREFIKEKYDWKITINKIESAYNITNI